MASSRNNPSTDDVAAACAAVLAAHVVPGQMLTAGLSGGLDSVSLLHVLRRLAPVAGFRLAALHVHHGLSANADQWTAFCERLCRDWGVALTVEYVDVERGSPDGLEAAARRARHAAFAGIPGDFIVLAHHRGDQAETMLFNLLRGAGPAGAAAMAPRQQRLLRPFLAVSRADLEAYAHAHALEWVDDESNLDTRFSRNFLRHDVLKLLTGRFPATERNLAAASSRFAEAATLLDELACIDLGSHVGGFPLPLAVLEGLSEPRARNVLRHLLARRGVRIPSEARLIEALRQLLAAAPDRHPCIVLGDWQLRRRRDNIELEAT